MNEGIHLDLDTWIVPGQIRKANLCRGLGNKAFGALLMMKLVVNHNGTSNGTVLEHLECLVQRFGVCTHHSCPRSE